MLRFFFLQGNMMMAERHESWWIMNTSLKIKQIYNCFSIFRHMSQNAFYNIRNISIEITMRK